MVVFMENGLGGMLIAEIRRIPAAGDTIGWSDCRFEVVDMDGYCVDKVLVSLIKPSRTEKHLLPGKPVA
jgi:putative hemolysin